MEALYTWMTNQGLDPASLPWIAGIVLVVLVLVIAQISKRRPQPPEQQNTLTEAQRKEVSAEIHEQADAAEAERKAAEEAEAAREQAEAAEAEKARQAAEEEARQKAAAEEAARQAEIAAAERKAAEEAEAAREQTEAAEAEKARQAAEEEARQKAAAEEAARQAEIAAAERKAAEEAEAAREQAEAAEAEKARQAAEEESRQKAAAEEAARQAEIAAAERKASEEAPEQQKQRLFARIKNGLSRTKANLTEQLSDLFLGAKEIDEDLLEEIETTLLMADIGVEATTEIIERLTDRVERKQLKDADALKEALKQELGDLLGGVEHPLQLPEKKPAVILMVGVNGVGKTTTIGKMAKKFQSEGKSVMLAAGDTFRAAAVEQLQVWGERNNVPVVAQHTGADSASVIFDALQSAQAKGVDVLIADTAGRLQNKDNLMQELQKVVRVMQKLDPEAPHEVMLVLDAGTGQNAISQAKQFKESVGVTGITLTKLDGTAKGGIIFAIAKQFSLPIRFIGVGEQVDDLRPFEADEFVQALFD